ncbi:alpha/beta hydrolase family protein [Pontibacter ummariensis]|uniref:Alpha/beta hydrolase fold n=1 Tax=Pontibacter ummariensis TaxID=1610492 RepID=A0A239JYN4_9BACT|nr:alpha/beta hydrolase fold domain-containing protein [Pontibacter ummariensis]PRY07279.1 alpha/beta hydrolase family protein [Pontibacter ummariensis]SNT10582.1 alpha/beta hydrolase fold [Pontibacter ummariensis]
MIVYQVWLRGVSYYFASFSLPNILFIVFGSIAHIQEHAAKYGADPTRIAVTGDSAGGHLSASAAVLSPSIGDGGFGAREGVYEFMPSFVPSGKPVDQVKDEIVRAIKVVAPSYGPSEASVFKMFLEQTDQVNPPIRPVFKS